MLVQPSVAAEACAWWVELQMLTGQDESRNLAKEALVDGWECVRPFASKPTPSDHLQMQERGETAQGIYPKHYCGKRVPRNGVGDLVSWIL